MTVFDTQFKKFSEKYWYLILPAIILIAGFLFEKALKQTKEEVYSPNVQIEKLRFALVYVCFIVFTLLMYFGDYGSILTKLMGPSMILSMVIAAIGLVYMLNLLSFPLFKPPPKDNKSSFSISWSGMLHLFSF